MKKVAGIILLVIGGLISLSTLSLISELSRPRNDAYDAGYMAGFVTAKLFTLVLGIGLIWGGLKLMKEEKAG